MVWRPLSLPSKLDSESNPGSLAAPITPCSPPASSKSTPAVTAINRLISSTNALSDHVKRLGNRLKTSNPSIVCPIPPLPDTADTYHLQETPLSRPFKVHRMVTCHGCHGPIGHGQHQGSELGKVKCNLPHSLYCRGGVSEDESWRGCPEGYQYNPSLDLANGVGFENTMHTYEFQSQYQPTLDPVFSTPASGGGLAPRVSSLLPRFPDSLRGISPAERIPSRINLPPQNTVPVSHALLHEMPGNIEKDIADHRAVNQVENNSSDRPTGDISIGDLRRDSSLRVEVENAIENLRMQVPSLSAADTAHPPSTNRSSSQPGPVFQPTQQSTHGRGPPNSTEQPSYNQSYAQQRPVIVQNMGRQHERPAQVYLTQPGSHSIYQGHTRLTVTPPQHHLAAPPTVQSGYTGPRPAVPQPNHQPPQARAVQQQSFQPGMQNYVPGPLHSGAGNPENVRQGSQVPQYGLDPQQQYHGSPQQQIQDLHQDRAVQYCYEWVPDGSGNRVLFRTPIKHPGPPVAPHASDVPGQTSTWCQSTCQVQPTPVNMHQQQPTPPPRQIPATFRTEYRCCPKTGRQWTVQVPTSPPVETMPPPPKPTLEWRIHPQTGVAYQVEIPHQNPPFYQQLPTQSHLQSQSYAAPHQVYRQQHIIAEPQVLHNESHQPVITQHSETQFNNSSLSKQDKVAGIVSLIEGGVTNRHPQVLDYAKKCPTKWAKQANMTNINLPLFAWGAVSELESSISGRSGALSESTVLGKLRHLKNILEVCCLNSAATDFTGYGWALARDYAVKVENEVEQKLVSWDEMSVGVRTATVLAAQMENPRKVEPPKKPLAGKTLKDICTTFNKCTTAGKCDYEVQNPDKSCQRKHECSWCKMNKGQSWNHQAWKCKNKEAAAQGST